MNENNYDYDYHDLAANSDFVEDDGFVLEESDDCNNFFAESSEEYSEYMREYPHYYHDIVDELED